MGHIKIKLVRNIRCNKWWWRHIRLTAIMDLNGFHPLTLTSHSNQNVFRYIIVQTYVHQTFITDFYCKRESLDKNMKTSQKYLKHKTTSNIWNNLKKLIQNLISFMQFLVKSQKRKKKKKHHQPNHMKMKRFLK